jgi:hypothetical protein
MRAPAEILREIVTAELNEPVPEPVTAMVEEIGRRHPARSIAAVLYYGSCLRRGLPTEGVLDFYLLVDDYRSFYGKRLPALANALLPPNVFYAECLWNGNELRAKYAVISMAQFARGVSAGNLQSALWARFAQPARLVEARDYAAAAAVTQAVIDAIVTFADAVVPLLPERFTAADLWQRGFAATYGAELRTEGPERPAELYAADRTRYEALAAPAVAAAGLASRPETDGVLLVSLIGSEREREKLRWQVRRVVGKLLNVLRLVKGVFTFAGGLDYVLWKVERHSGVRVPVSPWQRRHPLLAAPMVAWQLYRRGGFR